MFPREKAAKQNVIKYPLHIRYHRAALEQDHAGVSIEYPQTFVRCGPTKIPGRYLLLLNYPKNINEVANYTQLQKEVYTLNFSKYSKPRSCRTHARIWGTKLSSRKNSMCFQSSEANPKGMHFVSQ